jgi:hypothetical protein
MAAQVNGIKPQDKNGEQAKESAVQESEEKQNLGLTASDAYLANSCQTSLRPRRTLCDNDVNGELTNSGEINHPTMSMLEHGSKNQRRTPFRWCRWVGKWPKIFFGKLHNRLPACRIPKCVKHIGLFLMDVDLYNSAT